jgi:hypothetical protein
MLPDGPPVSPVLELAVLDVRRTELKHVLSCGALFLFAATSAPANPWDQVPSTVPYKNLADAVKASTPPGQQSALNPSCEGKTGDACSRSAVGLEQLRARAAPKEISKPPAPPKR